MLFLAQILFLLITPASAELVDARVNRVVGTSGRAVEAPSPVNRFGGMSRGSLIRPYGLDEGRSFTFGGQLYCPLYAASCFLIEEGARHYVPAKEHLNIVLSGIPAVQRDFLLTRCSQLSDACAVVLTGTATAGLNGLYITLEDIQMVLTGPDQNRHAPLCGDQGPGQRTRSWGGCDAD